jgi:uncharacterized protein YbjQ (UPF0145 family)
MMVNFFIMQLFRYSNLLYIHENNVVFALPNLKTTKKTQKMITTTTNSIEGRSIRTYLGVISSETIIGANVFKDILGGLRDFFGGRSGTYEKVMEEAKVTALRELEDKARAMGADAIVGIDLDFETIGANGSMLMVSASGTAVKLG